VSNHATEEVSVNIFQDTGNPQRIFIWSADGAKSPFRDEHGQKPGFKWTVSADPDSADYDPANFNRFGRYLRDKGKPAPEHDVPVRSRRLADRWSLLSPRLQRQTWQRLMP
jgi:hypothetical protein